jgi:ABC-type polysaccharide/polyol phosphate transport system ATPase subunit
MGSPGPAIEITDVSKTFVVPHDRRFRLKEYVVRPLGIRSYDRNEALKDLSLAVQPGEFFGIIGRNGSGKSTLLKIIAGIYRPDSGHVRINGILSPFIELGVGFNLELSARDNIEINGTLLGLSRREITNRLGEILAFAELERFVDQQLKNFSSGMLMRLAYSIAVQVPFEILLVDEVLAVGDASFQQKCFATFHQMRAEGKTIVFVSHDLHAVRTFCDRVVVIENGEVRGVGAADEMIELYLQREHAPPNVSQPAGDLNAQLSA